jgi:hypothetical protein
MAIIVLEPYEGSWPDDDPDAEFRRVVAEYSRRGSRHIARCAGSSRGCRR